MLRSVDRYLVTDVSGHVCCPEVSVITDLLCVTSQNSEDLIYTAING